jgi:ATPase subunit of ABC transporter with duplicated ATPase domains
MGINGAGKSTLLKLVAGSTPPDDGTVALGGSVKMGYFAQHAMDLLDGERTVFESLEDAFPQAGQGSLRALAGCFGFSGDDVEKRCRVLSGGEKARLVMAKMLFDPPNFLVLDEPTNHLDMATKEMLITALSQYEGTMLFVSHDRHFLAALSNRVLELTPRGHSPVRRWLHGVCGAHRPGGSRPARLSRDRKAEAQGRSVTAAVVAKMNSRPTPECFKSVSMPREARVGIRVVH